VTKLKMIQQNTAVAYGVGSLHTQRVWKDWINSHRKLLRG